MKVSLIQYAISWLQPEVNHDSAEKFIIQCSGSQLIVLPEMFATGFCMNPQQSSAQCQQSLEWMQNMAQKYNTAIAGSLAVEDNGEFYNRLYVVQKDGSYTKYDKRHLFTYSGEDKHYKGGDKRVIITIDGVRILLQICYDLRFPVWSRNRGDYDMILYVANWPKPRRAAWDALLRGRAIENLSYVCGVNIVGSDPSCIYSGGTVAIDFKGTTVAKVEDDVQGIASINIDMDNLSAFRSKFPALNDADDFEIK